MEYAVYPVMKQIEMNLPVYMYCAGYLDNQHPIYRPDGNPYFQCIQCAAGEGRLITGGQTYTVGPDQVMFLFPNSPYEYYAVREPWETYWYVFGGYQAESIAKLAGITRSGAYTVSPSDIFLTYIKNAYTIARSSQGLVGLECSKLGYTLLLDMMRYITHGEKSFEHESARLQPVFAFIEKNFDKVINLSDLSNLLGISSQYLCVLFRNLVNMRPMEYVNSFRISKSKEMMYRYRDKKIYEIAAMVGFESCGYFCTLFKKIEGVTPEAFKTLNGI